MRTLQQVRSGAGNNLFHKSQQEGDTGVGMPVEDEAPFLIPGNESASEKTSQVVRRVRLGEPRTIYLGVGSTAHNGQGSAVGVEILTLVP
jgi:hypothetical protein